MGDAVLVTGGAGYVGSETVAALLAAGRRVVVLDALTTGHRAAVPLGAELVVGDVADRTLLDELFTRWRFDSVIHFAALSLVGESMAEPLRYLETNFVGAARLIDACVRHSVGRFVFSSTANLFGEPQAQPIRESEALTPGSPYGESKLFIERALLWADRIHGLRSACLRYFNAAGAALDGRRGEDHHPETHLIPNLLAVALGDREQAAIFGDDYDTVDGTPVRDFVHVTDLADAHLRALDALSPPGAESLQLNLGTGTGSSVREVIQVVREVTGHQMPTRVEARRPGDPPVLIAANEGAKAALGWQPKHDLRSIVDSAYRWHQAHPRGYQSTK